MHDYYYGAQASQFSFIRVPTLLFTDDQYKYVSAEAKVLYGILLRRMDLSAKNGWVDDQGRVYIICTISEIMETLNCADNKATKLMNELEDKCGLIERKRQGLGKPNLIYVKNFLTVDNLVESRFKSRDYHDSGVAESTNPEPSKSRPSNKDQKDIDLSYTENSLIWPAFSRLCFAGSCRASIWQPICCPMRHAETECKEYSEPILPAFLSGMRWAACL